MATIEVFEPAGSVQKLTPVTLNPVESLAGLRIAILSNTKPNFTLLATLLSNRLRDDFAIGSVEHFKKDNAAVGASAELLNRIAQSADLVITGSAD